MTVAASTDGVLVQRGERLLYPQSRIVKQVPSFRLDNVTRRKAAVIGSVRFHLSASPGRRRLRQTMSTPIAERGSSEVD